jgi:hypothetical protein
MRSPVCVVVGAPIDPPLLTELFFISTGESIGRLTNRSTKMVKFSLNGMKSTLMP